MSLPKGIYDVSRNNSDIFKKKSFNEGFYDLQCNILLK